MVGSAHRAGTSHMPLRRPQQHRPAKVLTDERHAAFVTTWSIYQDVIDACLAPDPAEGKKIMTPMIDLLKTACRPASTNSDHWARPCTDAETTSRHIRPPRHIKRPHRIHQRLAGTPPRDRPRVPKHRTLPAPHRRVDGARKLTRRAVTAQPSSAVETADSNPESTAF